MEKPFRTAVTGSRGKSGVVRLIHAAFCACGLKAYGRITGVVPRELRPDGERPIIRLSGTNVSEMKWWLSTLPCDTEGIVLENSAVTPDLQRLCALWLHPQVIVLTNIRPDHEAYWGSGEENVLRALSHALPKGSSVVLPADLAANPAMEFFAEKKRLKLLPAEKIEGLPPHLSANTGLALEVCHFFGLNESQCKNAMKTLPADFADFTILNIGKGKLAFAFSANDVTTTEELFQSTGWEREETCVLFNHRSDRVDRFRSFESWMAEQPWKQVLIIGDRPPRTKLKCIYFPCSTVKQLADRISSGCWFGCGNTVYGLPLSLKLTSEEGGLDSE
jgi:poly-gamma-glutamate synthase PgsB/CapB